jgi:hypothetical protein
MSRCDASSVRLDGLPKPERSKENAKTTGHPATPEAPGWMFDAEAIRTVALYQVVLITLRIVQKINSV